MTNYSIPKHIVDKGYSYVEAYLKDYEKLIKNKRMIKEKSIEINLLKKEIFDSNFLIYETFGSTLNSLQFIKKDYLIESQRIVELSKELERKTYELFDLLRKRENIEKKYDL